MSNIVKKKPLTKNLSAPALNHNKCCEHWKKVKKVHFAEESLENKKKSDDQHFDNPKFFTVLQLAKEVENIRKMQCSAPCASHKLGLKNLNFMPDEKVFQDLVELRLPEKEVVKSSRSLSSLKSISKKDPEPNYSDLLKLNSSVGYVFLSSANPVVKKQTLTFEGCSLYKRVKVWKGKDNYF